MGHNFPLNNWKDDSNDGLAMFGWKLRVKFANMRYFPSEHKHGLCVEHVHFSFGMLFRTNNSCFISSAGINDFVLGGLYMLTFRPYSCERYTKVEWDFHRNSNIYSANVVLNRLSWCSWCSQASFKSNAEHFGISFSLTLITLFLSRDALLPRVLPIPLHPIFFSRLFRNCSKNLSHTMINRKIKQRELLLRKPLTVSEESLHIFPSYHYKTTWHVICYVTRIPKCHHSKVAVRFLLIPKQHF